MIIIFSYKPKGSKKNRSPTCAFKIDLWNAIFVYLCKTLTKFLTFIRVYATETNIAQLVYSDKKY